MQEPPQEQAEELVGHLEAMWEGLVASFPGIVAAVVAFVVVLVIGSLVARAVARTLDRTRFSGTHKAFFRKLTVWLFALLGLYLALVALGFNQVAASILAGGGITAVVLGFAFREIGENLLAGFFLAFSRPFEVGDLIRSGEFEGVVRGVDIRHTHIRTADGRDIYVPSARIFNDPLVNYTRDGLRRPSFRIGIDYGDDADAALEVLVRVATETDGVLEVPRPLAVVAEFQAGHVDLESTFWVDTMGPAAASVAEVRSDVMLATRRALREAGFTFSSEVTTALESGGDRPFRLALEEGVGAAGGRREGAAPTGEDPEPGDDAGAG